MRIALIFPPTADPTAPYISVPLLTAYLRREGHDVLPVDANVEGWEAILSSSFLEECGRRVELRLGNLQGRTSHAERVLKSQLLQAPLPPPPGAVEDALAFFRGNAGRSFFDGGCYRAAVEVVEGAQELVGAAFAPLSLSFVQYRTPFALQGLEEIEHDAHPDRNPFHSFYEKVVIPRLAGRDIVGISVVFPGQIQQAFSLAWLIRKAFPSIHVTVGGPAITQLLLRLPEDERESALGPFHSAVLFEGEEALRDMAMLIEKEEPVPRIVRGRHGGGLAGLPAPDFAGLPLEKYLAPELVLPYDPTRGCYWGKCAFCHYGLSEKGTARYRERPAAEVVEHLGELRERFGATVFHLSQDALAPATALRLAKAITERGLDVRWASDIRPERALSPEVCRELRAAGALAFSFGVESASARVLALIEKGVTPLDVSAAVRAAAVAGIAVEAMCFTDFPTESGREALETLGFIHEHRDAISLFICGEFHLVAGSAVAARPERYGIRRTWHVAGDVLRTMMFFEEKNEPKSDREREKIDARLDEISRHWWLGHYPWAGALSTAHTLLWYREKGPGAFREVSKGGRGRGLRRARDVSQAEAHKMEKTMELDAEIWSELVWERRDVSRRMYEIVVKARTRR